MLSHDRPENYRKICRDVQLYSELLVKSFRAFVLQWLCACGDILSRLAIGLRRHIGPIVSLFRRLFYVEGRNLGRDFSLHLVSTASWVLADSLSGHHYRSNLIRL